jgi:hypothetical protein
MSEPQLIDEPTEDEITDQLDQWAALLATSIGREAAAAYLADLADEIETLPARERPFQ